MYAPRAVGDIVIQKCSLVLVKQISYNIEIPQKEVWGDDSEVKSGCSSRGRRFDSQHPHDASQLSLTAVPGIQCPLLCEHQAGTWFMQIKHQCASIKEKM